MAYEWDPRLGTDNRPLYGKADQTTGKKTSPDWAKNAVGKVADTVGAVNSMKQKSGGESTAGDSPANNAGSRSSGGGYSSRSGGGTSSGPTSNDRRAAANQIEIARTDADATRRQLDRQLARYDFMNRQNAKLRDVNMQQSSRQSAGNRFDALTNLANSAVGIMSALGPQALQSSSLGTFMQMMDRRNLQDSGTYWDELDQNWDQSRNAYDEAAAQNQASRMDAVIEAEKALADQESALSANLNNINANLYQKPGTGSADLGSSSVYGDNPVQEHYAQLAGYAMPDYATQDARATAPRNKVRGGYFARQVNRNNGYR